jgi:hypothetical protein
LEVRVRREERVGESTATANSSALDHGGFGRMGVLC